MIPTAPARIEQDVTELTGRGWWNSIAIPASRLYPIAVGPINIMMDYRIDYDIQRIIAETPLRTQYDEDVVYYYTLEMARRDFDDMDTWGRNLTMTHLMEVFADRLYDFYHETHIIRGEN